MTGPGTLIAERYRVVRHLGSGAMASVHLALDQVLGRPVAIKSVHADPKSEFGRRVLREARMGAALSHSSLVAVFDTLVTDDSVLLVTEYVPGRTLADELRQGRMTPERALQILRPLADALDHTHAAGIVHRDVKPANILLHERGDVKLADLGVATSDEVSRITHTGGVVGTAAYMAPEQFESGPVDGAADTYALAAVGFEMLAGRRAFPAPSALAALVQRSQEPPDLRELMPDAPEAAAVALKRGMAPRPGDRPITATALVDELEAAYRPRAAAAPAKAPTPTPTPAPPANSPASTARPTPRPASAQPAKRRRLESTPAPAAAAAAAPPARRRAASLAALSLLLVAGVVLAIVLAATGDDEKSGGRAAAPETAERTTTSNAATSAAPQAAQSTTPAQPAASTASPAGAVRAFYERAADGDLDGAWELASPSLRAQFGGSRGRFDGTFRTLRDVRFTRLATTGRTGSDATVAIATVATHEDRTERCRGEMRATRDGDGRWLVASAGVQCTRAS